MRLTLDDQFSTMDHYRDADWASQMGNMNDPMACMMKSVPEPIGVTDMPWFWQTPECLAEFRQGRPFCTSADLTNVSENHNMSELDFAPIASAPSLHCQSSLDWSLDMLNEDYLTLATPTTSDSRGNIDTIPDGYTTADSNT